MQPDVRSPTLRHRRCCDPTAHCNMSRDHEMPFRPHCYAKHEMRPIVTPMFRGPQLRDNELKCSSSGFSSSRLAVDASLHAGVTLKMYWADRCG